MKHMHSPTLLLVLAAFSFVSYAHEWSLVSAPHPVMTADLQEVLRDEWSRRRFWIRNVVLDNTMNDLRSRDFAEKAVAANARDIARTFTPFYGIRVSDRFHT